MKASGAARAAAMKKAGKGIFAPKNLSADLAAITGKNKMPRTEARAADPIPLRLQIDPRAGVK